MRWSVRSQSRRGVRHPCSRMLHVRRYHGNCSEIFSHNELSHHITVKAVHFFKVSELRYLKIKWKQHLLNRILHSVISNRHETSMRFTFEPGLITAEDLVLKPGSKHCRLSILTPSPRGTDYFVFKYVHNWFTWPMLSWEGLRATQLWNRNS